MGIAGRNNDSTDCDDEADDDLPLIEEILGPISHWESRQEETGMLKLHYKISISQLLTQVEAVLVQNSQD